MARSLTVAAFLAAAVVSGGVFEDFVSHTFDVEDWSAAMISVMLLLVRS